MKLAVVYVNVGLLPKKKAEEHVQYIKAQWNDQVKFRSYMQTMFFPVRGDQNSGVEIFDLD